MRTKLKNKFEKGENGMFYTFYNSRGTEEFYIHLGFENYKISGVKDLPNIYRIKTAGDRDVIGTIDTDKQLFFLHKGEIRAVGRKDFKVVKDGVRLLTFNHHPNSVIYQVVDITEHMTKDNLKFHAYDIVDVEEVESYTPQEIDVAEYDEESLSEVDVLLNEHDKLMELASMKRQDAEEVARKKRIEVLNMSEQYLAENLNMSLEGKKLTIVVPDITKELGKSGSGKSKIIASTRGNKSIPSTDLKLGFNLYKPE
jgi:hypothetical protein